MIDGNESFWVALKFQGFFKGYDTFEQYRARNKKVKTVAQAVEEEKIKENIRKSEELELLKVSYNPKPRDPAELAKYEEEQRKKAHEKWKREHLITNHQKEIYKGLNGGTLDEPEEKPLTKKEIEKQRLIDEKNEDTEANYEKFIGAKSIL